MGWPILWPRHPSTHITTSLHHHITVAIIARSHRSHITTSPHPTIHHHVTSVPPLDTTSPRHCITTSHWCRPVSSFHITTSLHHYWLHVGSILAPHPNITTSHVSNVSDNTHHHITTSHYTSPHHTNIPHHITTSLHHHITLQAHYRHK